MQCDNKECNWSDPDIPMAKWDNYRNAKYPVCSANLMTDKCYVKTLKFINIAISVENMTHMLRGKSKDNTQDAKNGTYVARVKCDENGPNLMNVNCERPN